MYGDPALPPDFVALPYANPDAPKGGKVVFGNTGSFDSLNPFVQKGNPPWQLRFWGYESLMGRSYDEPFTLYGLLAESVDTAPDRSWVEFTLRPEARFSDGTPVTVDDVIWSYETLGTQGHGRYRGFWSKIDSITATGDRSVRITFNTEDRELALIAGMRPILQKAQWEGRDFAATANEAPIGTGAYVVSDHEFGRHITLSRNPDYWGKDVNLRRGTQNFDTLRIDFFGDDVVLFEAFKAGELSAIYEFNADAWNTRYDFPAVRSGEIVKSEIVNAKPSGITGLVMNTRRPPFDDWRVRQAMIEAFNFEYIADTMTGGAQPRITSYFSNSELGMTPGPASGKVQDVLIPFADDLLPGAIDGYALPVSDGTARNRAGLRRARALLEDAGWTVQDGTLRNGDGQPFAFTILLRQNDRVLQNMETLVDLYLPALERLGMQVRVDRVDDAQYVEREAEFDFDMTSYRRDLSLSPGNEQRFYWGSEAADLSGTRNLMGAKSPAIDALIDQMLTSTSREDFAAATRALDRVLMSGRYVIPFWSFGESRIAHARALTYRTDHVPIYGADPRGFLPYVWWYEDN
ncbi:MAG: extracellular solute-binding protein [Marinibacterium sp.]|nr:extracellular solute-binding protein [Marinibacterium sp.]